MESVRTFLFIAFAFLTFLLYQQWQKAHAPLPAVTQTQPVKQSSASQADPNAEGEVAPATLLQPEGEVPSAHTSITNPAQSNNAQVIRVETDKFIIQISSLRGDLISARLKDYRLTLDENSPPLDILDNQNGRVYLAQSGLFGEGAPDQRREVIWHASQTEYQLGDQDRLNVDLKWVNPEGVVYTKRFVFQKDSYQIQVEYLIDNQSANAIANRMFTQIRHDHQKPAYAQSQGFGIRAYLGVAFSTDEVNYKKYDFDDIEEKNLSVTTKNGWIAFLQHYFVSAWIPTAEGPNQIESKQEPNQIVRIRLKQPWVTVQPGETARLAAKFYVGPKIQERLEKAAKHLDLTVDYGWLWWIGQPIFALLKFFQSLVVNWGVAIILVTLTIKTLLYPLARAQYRSFAKMRLLQPKLTEMKERYGDDRQQMSMKMMELYKKEKVNPLGGCLPLLIQMPVFLALYWVLMESVEIRHAPFILWIKDLSVMDPYYVLPLLMGASMYLMQKMQPTSPTMDPMQQKMLQMMPVFMTIFFVFFPAGLVLYWLMNNLISIAQQLYITNQFNKEQAAKGKAKKA